LFKNLELAEIDYLLTGISVSRLFRQKSMWLSQPSDFYISCQVVAWLNLKYPFNVKVAIGFLNVAKASSPYFWVSSHIDSMEEVPLL
jgi:hypothetical protein